MLPAALTQLVPSEGGRHAIWIFFFAIEKSLVHVVGVGA